MAVILSDVGEACGRSGRACLLPPRLGDLWTKLITFPKEALQLVEMEATFTKQQLDELSISESETRGCCLSGSHRGLAVSKFPWQARPEPCQNLESWQGSADLPVGPGRRPSCCSNQSTSPCGFCCCCCFPGTDWQEASRQPCPTWEKPGTAHSFLEQRSPPPVPGNPRVGSCGGRTHCRACCGCREVALSEREERLTPGPLGGGHLP